LIRRLAVAVLGLSLFATSCAGMGQTGPGGKAAQPPTREPTQTQPPTGSLGSPEAAPADGTISHAASTLSGKLSGDAQLASVEVIEGNRIIVHWHGTVSATLRDLLARFPNVDISVQSAACSPGKLSDFASELWATDPAVNITSVSPDGSYLTITLDESVKATSDVPSLERKYSKAAGCPVKVEFGGVAPADG
jgi:hypothetical protein